MNMPTRDQLEGWGGFIQKVGLIGVLLMGVLMFGGYVYYHTLEQSQKKDEQYLRDSQTRAAERLERIKALEDRVDKANEATILANEKTLEITTGVLSETNKVIQNNTEAIRGQAQSLDRFSQETVKLATEVEKLSNRIEEVKEMTMSIVPTIRNGNNGNN